MLKLECFQPPTQLTSPCRVRGARRLCSSCRSSNTPSRPSLRPRRPRSRGEGASSEETVLCFELLEWKLEHYVGGRFQARVELAPPYRVAHEGGDRVVGAAQLFLCLHELVLTPPEVGGRGASSETRFQVESTVFLNPFLTANFETGGALKSGSACTTPPRSSRCRSTPPPPRQPRKSAVTTKRNCFCVVGSLRHPELFAVKLRKHAGC